jgi:hypothetical protein
VVARGMPILACKKGLTIGTDHSSPVAQRWPARAAGAEPAITWFNSDTIRLPQHRFANCSP